MITLQIIGGILICGIILVVASYIKAPPDEVFLISGLRKNSRKVIGKATLRIPFLERVDKLPLRLIQVDIKTQNSVPTSEFINIFVDGVANIKISSNPELLDRAAQQFLNRDIREIGEVAQQVLEGNMREIIGQMKLTDLVNKRDEFGVKVQENATKDMEAMGLEIVNLTVQNFTDENNVIDNLGIDNITKIQKDAQIAKAQSQRDVQIAQAKADEEGAKARAEADANIAEQQKILVIKQAQFKKEQDIKKAEADAAYKIEQAEQQKAINESTIAAEVKKAERMTELKEKEVALKEKELDALVRKQADADKYAAEQKAKAEKEVRQQNAEAQLIEAESLAKARIAKAKAEKEASELEAEGIKAKLQAEADGKKAMLLAEAEGVKAKGLAEAEAIEKKAEAQAKMKEASIVEMTMNALPLIAKEVSTPLSNINSITMYGDQSTKLVEENTQKINKVLKVAEDSLGLDLRRLINKFVTNEPGMTDDEDN